jgi:hypothetical protein
LQGQAGGELRETGRRRALATALELLPPDARAGECDLLRFGFLSAALTRIHVYLAGWPPSV